MIENGKKVKFHYELKIGDELIESSHSGSPLEYVHGKDNIIPGLQKGLEGSEEGDKKTIEVEPEEGYGPMDPKAVIEVDKKNIPEEGLKTGEKLVAKNAEGQTIHGIIQDIRENTVLIDFNHPLAGKTLVFDVEILSVSLNM